MEIAIFIFLAMIAVGMSGFLFSGRCFTETDIPRKGIISLIFFIVGCLGSVVWAALYFWSTYLK